MMVVGGITGGVRSACGNIGKGCTAKHAGLVEKKGLLRRTRSQLLDEAVQEGQQGVETHRSELHAPFEAFFSSDAAALVQHTRR